MPILGAAGAMMQWIESKGYFISFLIQDGLGMTAPRVWTGFKRDKEITGHYNKQEGLEVLGREGMTGPYIVGVAPAVLALSGRFCKSTNTNTRLIKRFGDSLKNMVKSPEFENSVKKDKEKFMNAFFEKNIENIYKNSVPNDKNADESIKKIVKEFKVFENGSKKDKEQALANITEYINSKITETSSDLYKINKVYVGDDNTKQLFSIKDAFTALKDYGTDAIKNNKNSETLDEVAAENIKNNFAAKRLGVNVANIAITLGGLSYLPKIYAKSDVSCFFIAYSLIYSYINERSRFFYKQLLPQKLFYSSLACGVRMLSITRATPSSLLDTVTILACSFTLSFAFATATPIPAFLIILISLFESPMHMISSGLTP